MTNKTISLIIICLLIYIIFFPVIQANFNLNNNKTTYKIKPDKDNIFEIEVFQYKENGDIEKSVKKNF